MRIFRQISATALLIGLLWTSQAPAALHLELTQGMNAAIPIAITPFANQTNNVPGNTTISQVISNDLQNSGEFNVQSNPKNANDLVVGQVRQTGTNQYAVSFQLTNLYAPANTAKNAQNNNALLSLSFTSNQAGLRGLAHHISDLIYQKLTGTRGVFQRKLLTCWHNITVKIKPIISW